MHGHGKRNMSWRRVGNNKTVRLYNSGKVVGRVLCMTNSGYLQFGLDNKNVYVHRIVYETFVGVIPKGYDINHIDGNKLNNNVSNLEAVTRSENQKHAARIGLRKTTKTFGVDNGRYNEGVSTIPSYGKLWHLAKGKGLDWKAMSKAQRLALLPEIDNGATFEMIKA